MIKIIKYFFYSFFISIILALIFVPEDREWIDCSDEKDLYRYVYNGWKVDKVIKDYKGEYPQIYLSKNDRIKALNFGWRCYYLEGAELNYKKKTSDQDDMVFFTKTIGSSVIALDIAWTHDMIGMRFANSEQLITFMGKAGTTKGDWRDLVK